MSAVSSHHSMDEKLLFVRSQIRHAAVTFKAIYDSRWPDSPVRQLPATPLHIAPLQITIPQIFYDKLDQAQISTTLRDKLQSHVQERISSYSETFNNACSRLGSVSSPSLRATIPSVIEQLRRSFQTHFEQEILPEILQEMDSFLQRRTGIDTDEKRPFNHAYTPVLERYFDMNPKPSAADQEHLAAKSGMSRRQIEVWFQNRRRRTKAQHLEKGEKYHPQRSSGFADENIDKLRTGLPNYLLQAEGANTVDLAEKVASADLEREERDFRRESKHASFHTPRYTRTADTTENPLNPSPAPLPAPFKPKEELPTSEQFPHRTSRPHFPEISWDRSPYIPRLTTPPVKPKKPRGRAAQLAKANPRLTQAQQQANLDPVEDLIKQFDTRFHIDNRDVPEPFLCYWRGVGPKLPDAATYAKTVRPPLGRHPALVVPGSRPIPNGAVVGATMTPTRKPRKQAGLPRRTPKHPQRRGSRSPTPPLDSRVTSFASTISSTSTSSLRRQSSVSSFSSSDSSSSDTASPLFSPVDLPQAVAVAGTDFPFDNDGAGSGFSFAMPPPTAVGKADDVQIMFPTGFGNMGEEFSFFDDLGFGFQVSG
ncbi:hypothetical protein PQX77_001793 [Marasmius sp. AFHP31]|nr:hypothetical protein PQX77_001793 [Marasmius sp. AFHP31]